MLTTIRRSEAFLGAIGALTLAYPVISFAQAEAAGVDIGAFTLIGVLIAFLILSALLTKVWIGILNVSLLDVEPIASIERRHPYLPSLRVIGASLVTTAVLAAFSVKAVGFVAPFQGEAGLVRAGIVFSVFAVVCIGALLLWKHAREFVFAATLGTVVAIILIGFTQTLLSPEMTRDPFAMALGVAAVAIAWRFLFGPWTPEIKATVLGTFILWIAAHMLWRETDAERQAHLLAILVAMVPAVIWCLLFLKYHIERLTLVLLMFFAGMLSTAPILFYDALVRRGVELQFFLFRIVPENFSRSSSVFVSGTLSGAGDVQATLLTTLLSFLLVGCIEEGSKFWVLRKSGLPFFRSINDVLELSIIVAIGFAFAENIVNPTYFIGFVQQYLISGDPSWGAFFGNVIGRAILTNMVHILSTGVLGYFFGIAIFAPLLLEDERKAGRTSLLVLLARGLFRLPEKAVFRKQAIFTGFLAAVVLHGLFNFTVSLPDILPGNPRTIGAFFSFISSPLLANVSLILIPALFYVVGGFWFLTLLFAQGENRKDRGQLVLTDSFVRAEA